MAYVAVTDILSDLCQLWVRRKSEASAEDMDLISQRLQKVIASLPSKLCLYNASERSHLAFNLEVAQLHIQILSTIIILHRPKSIYALSEHNAAAIIAANISSQIFEGYSAAGAPPLAQSCSYMVSVCGSRPSHIVLANQGAKGSIRHYIGILSKES